MYARNDLFFLHDKSSFNRASSYPFIYQHVTLYEELLKRTSAKKSWLALLLLVISLYHSCIAHLDHEVLGL